MSSELLPEWLNLLLDDVENILCLPILAIIVLCTAQFIFNLFFDIGNTFYQNIKQSSGGGSVARYAKGKGIIGQLKGILSKIGLGASNNIVANPTPDAITLAPGSNSQEEEWDYCEEDED